MNSNTFMTVGMGLLIFVIGVVVGNATAGKVGPASTTPSGSSQTVVTDTTNNPAATPVASGTSTSGNGSEVAFTINIANLPDAQKAFLRTMGVTGDTIPVTNTMLLCAEASVSTDRVTAIKNGATPTMSEGLKLASCYK